MLTAFAILGVLAALFLAAALATRDSEALAPAAPDVADLVLPDGALRGDDVRGLRFGLAARGYRMREVDAALARLATELEDRDRRIAELEQPAPAATETSGQTPVGAAVVEPEPISAAPPATPTTDAASAVDDLDFPEVGLPDVDADADHAADLPHADHAAPAAPDVSVGQAPVEPVDPPVRSS